MTRPTAVIIPAEATLRDIARHPDAAHLHLITDGRRTALSSVVPAGWQRLAIHVKATDDGGPACTR